jgi:hypothetical protein
MPGLVPGIHVLGAAWLCVEGRDKPGHDALSHVGEARKAYCFCNFVSVPVPLLSVAE